MSRTMLPFHADDVSALARALKRELDRRSTPPGHVEWLNILARAKGYRNYQHFRAEAEPSQPSEIMPPPPVQQVAAEPVDLKRVEAAARCFDVDGVLLRWPARTTVQQLCLWRLWSAFPADLDMSEAEVNAFLKARNGFGDHVLIRREMVNMKLLDRDRDCRRYRRLEQRPPAEALAVIRGTLPTCVATTATPKAVSAYRGTARPVMQ